MMVDWKPTSAVAHSLPPPPENHHSYHNYHSPPQYHPRGHPPPPPSGPPPGPPPRSFHPQHPLPPNSAPIAHPHPPPPPPAQFPGRPPAYGESPRTGAPPDAVKHNSSPLQYGPGPDGHDSPEQRADQQPRRRRSSTSRPHTEDASSLTRRRSYANGGSPHEQETSPRPAPTGESHTRQREMEYHPTYGPPLIDRMREQHHMHPPALHGHPLPPHLDTSVGPSYGPHSHPQSAPPYGTQPYGYGGSGYETPGGMDSSQKRKAVRASQACDNCRAKKAKCDENRPCGNCANQNIVCNFRDMPAPKQERSMMQLSDQVNGLGQRMHSIESLLHKIASQVNSDMSSPPGGDRTSRDRFITPDGYPASHATSAISNHPSSQTYSYRTLESRPEAPNGTSQHWEPPEAPNEHYEYIPNDQPRMPSQRAHIPLEELENSQSFDENPESKLSREIARRGQAAHEEMLSKDYLNGKVALAPKHLTAANHLIDWPTIATFFGDIADRNYVKRGEFYHGLDLRQRSRKFDRAMSTPGGSPMGAGDNDDASTVSNTSDGRPALAFVRQGAEGSRGMHYTPGGRNPRDQSLSIDNETSFRLLNSYFHHIHLLQPFLNKERARNLVQDFVNSYYFEPTFTSSPMEHSTSHGSNGATKRRKYNHGLHSQNRSPGGKVPIARTVENALVLLIFALGKVCEHEGPLPPLIGEQKLIPEGTHVPEGVICTPSKTYPGMVETKHIHAQEEVMARIDQQGNDPYSADIDRIPGLAYYVHAAQILGEMHGDNSLTQVHARLLAGLYLGQLLRVNESWQWIKGACDAWQMLFKQRDEVLGKLAYDERAAFWACLMLESDILAEHDCIPSGISKWEDAFTAYDDTLLKMDINNPAEEERYCFFVQGIIRSILNRSHSALYVPNEDKEEHSEWQKLSADDYMKQLQRWRDHLPEYLQWDNFEGPATAINRARLRGKFWGARYVIYRPYLRQILDPSFQNSQAYEDAEHQAHFTEKKELMDRHAHACLDAAKKSTVAFDAVPGMRKRLIVTNPFGTAQAQFSNVMVLSAAYCADHLGGFITLEDLLYYIDRTREFLSYLAPLSPTMSTDIRILDNTRQIVIDREKDTITNGVVQSAPASANNSFYTPTT